MKLKVTLDDYDLCEAAKMWLEKKLGGQVTLEISDDSQANFEEDVTFDIERVSGTFYNVRFQFDGPLDTEQFIRSLGSGDREAELNVLLQNGDARIASIEVILEKTHTDRPPKSALESTRFEDEKNP